MWRTLCLALAAAGTLPAAELVYSVTLHGAQTLAIAADSQGNTYLTGEASGTFPSAPRWFQPATGGFGDAFVLKIDPTGQVLWGALLGGSELDWAYHIAVDSAGDVYVVGVTDSRDFPRTAGLPGTACPCSFIAKLAGDGSALRYSFLFPYHLLPQGGPALGAPAGLAVDGGGHAYVTGAADPEMTPTPGALRTQAVGQDAFVGKLNAAGSGWDYLTLLGGSDSDYGLDIAVNPAGETYVAVSSESADFPGGQLLGGGSAGIFVVRLNAGGSAILWSSAVAQVDLSKGAGWAHVVLDPAGSAYLTYCCTSESPGWGMKKLSANGELAYSLSRVFPVSGAGPLLAVNAGGEAILGGDGVSYGAVPVTTGAVQYADYGDDIVSPGFVLKLDAAGANVLYGSYVGGGTASVNVESLAVDGTGGLYVAFSSGVQITTLQKTDLTRTPPVWLGAVVNAASFHAGPVSPSELITIFGTGLGPAAPLAANLGSGQLPTRLGDTQVLVNGVPAPLLFVSDTQVNAVVPSSVGSPSVPFEVSSTAEIVVAAGELRSPPLTIPVRGASLGVFTVDQSGKGQVVALNEDGTFNSPANPARQGSTVTIFLTGAGLTNPAGADGTFTSSGESGSFVYGPPRVAFGSAWAQVTQAGPAPGMLAGIGTVAFRVPAYSPTGLPEITIGPAVRFMVYFDVTPGVEGITLAIQ